MSEDAEDAFVDDSTTSKKRKKPNATTSVSHCVSVLDNDLLNGFVKSFHYFNHAAVFKFITKESFVTEDSIQQFLKGDSLVIMRLTLNPINEITDDYYTFYNILPQTFLESLFETKSKWHRLTVAFSRDINLCTITNIVYKANKENDYSEYYSQYRQYYT